MAQEDSTGFDVRGVPRCKLKRGAIQRKARTLTHRKVPVEHMCRSVWLCTQHGINATGQHPIAVWKNRNLDALTALAAVQFVTDTRTIGQRHHGRAPAQQGKRGCAVDV